ncbi:MAG TPA: hypothetical protein VFF06_31225 [Polyangia bacterium]|nr:hypothetical protein [Polyangia bacterium]
MTDYQQPRRLNAVSITLILLALGACYWFWRFFPAYFDGWTVDHVLKESAAAVYRTNRLSEPERSQELRALVDKTRADIIKKANVNDPELTVNLDIDGNLATFTADYRVVVTHPVTSRTTLLHFVKTQSSDIKAVSWK